MARNASRDKLTGALLYVRGRLRSLLGSRTGNRKHSRSGLADQLKGGLRNKKGHAKSRLK